MGTSVEDAYVERLHEDIQIAVRVIVFFIEFDVYNNKHESRH